MLAKMYHAVIPRRAAAGLCQTAIPSTPSLLSLTQMDHLPIPIPNGRGLPGSTMGHAPEARVI